MIDHNYEAAWRLGRRHFNYVDAAQPQPRGMLIGEAPGPNTNAKLPLYPMPNNSAAGRLLKYAGIEAVDYLGRLVRMNMCDDEWSERRAVAGRTRATTWLLDSDNFFDGKPLRVLLLGVRVARAWSCHGPFGSTTMIYDAEVEVRVAWIPHPSGRCLLYNDRKNQLRARRAVQWAIGTRANP